jgi:hypothetical protein
MFRYSKNMVIVLIAAILSNFAGASEVSFEIVAPRPMAEGVMILAEQLGSMITYEDPPFQYSDELRKPFPNSSIFVPKGGHISYDYDPANTNSEVILGLINKHHEAGNAGEFTLLKTGEIYNVLPVRYQNSAGQLVNHVSPLDTEITLSLKETNCYDALNKLCLAVSQSNNNYQLKFAGMSINIFVSTPFSREIAREPARNVLNEILSTVNKNLINTNKRLVWQLRFALQDGSMVRAPTYLLCFLPVSLNNPSPRRMKVVDQRPMATAAKILEKKFGKTISYEDPPYVCDCDVMGNSTGKRLAGGIIDISWEPHEGINDVLRILTETPIRPRPNPEVFKFSKSEGKYHIYPYKSKDKEGNLVTRTPIMDAAISFNAQNVNGTALFELICNKLSDSTKKNIVLGATPEILSNTLKNRAFPAVSVTNQRAEAVLNQLLGEISSEISWQLLFNPTLEQYELTLYNK